MNKKYFIFVISIVLLSIFSVSFVSARHSWWHFWGDDVYFAPGTCKECPNLMTRGDANNDCGIDISDPIFIKGLYTGTSKFCNGQSYYEPADVNGDNDIDISDAIYLEDWLFKGGPAPVKLSVSETCVDSDGGKKQYVFGIVNITNKTGSHQFKDFCSGGDVNEYFCNVDGKTKNSTLFNCEAGCADGKCVKDAGQTCTDDDGGLNYDIKGFTNFTNKTGALIRLPDVCNSPGELKEYSCNADGTLNTQLKTCSCFDGACLANATNQTSCTDSDGGRKQDVKGTAKACVGDKCDSEIDVCLNSTIVLENYCTKDKLTSESIFCNLGCLDGACKLAGNATNQTISICGNKILEGLEEECDDGNLVNGDGCSALCKKEIVGGKILRVSKIINSTVGFSSDEVELIDIRTGDIYRANIIAEGVGDVSIEGLVYNIYYQDNRDIDGDEYIKFTGNGVEQMVFKMAFIVLGEPVFDGKILKVTRISNFEGINNDRVEFQDLKTGDIYLATIIREGVATIDIGGLVYWLYYNGEAVYMTRTNLPDSFFNQQAFRGSFILIPTNVPAESCKLIGASWGVASSPVGVQVNLVATGSDCQDQEVSFEVREKDAVSADDPVLVKPGNANFVNGVANSQWLVENQVDEGFTKPEYYFVARLVSEPETDIASGLLQVV